MRFYTQSHCYYCVIDLHARWMYLCILNPQGEILLHPFAPGQRLSESRRAKRSKIEERNLWRISCSVQLRTRVF